MTAARSWLTPRPVRCSRSTSRGYAAHREVAAVLTLTFTRETDGLSAQFTQKLVSGTSFTHVVLTLYRTGTLSPQVVYDLQPAKLDDVDRDGDEETWTIRPTGKYSETTYSADGSSSKWCLNTVTTEIGC